MRNYLLALRLLGAVFIAVAGLHLVLGLGADALLGSPVTPEMASNPSFDSQNRFYGVSFALLGVVMLIAATDLARYRPMLLGALAVLFASGIGRAVAWALHGTPAPALIVILVADLVLPPLHYLWMRNVMHETR